MKGHDLDCFQGERNDKGQYHGLGYLINLDYFYIGMFKDGHMHGYGTYTYANGNKYEGEWIASKRHGKGTMLYKDRSKYEGYFEKGHYHGRGIKI